MIEHAYGPGGGTVTVRLELRSNDVVATVRDTGRWRPPRGENRGRGLLLMSRCCDEVSIDRTDEGTTVVITYGLGRGSEH